MVNDSIDLNDCMLIVLIIFELVLAFDFGVICLFLVEYVARQIELVYNIIQGL